MFFKIVSGSPCQKLDQNQQYCEPPNNDFSVNSPSRIIYLPKIKGGRGVGGGGRTPFGQLFVVEIVQGPLYRNLVFKCAKLTAEIHIRVSHVSIHTKAYRIVFLDQK